MDLLLIIYCLFPIVSFMLLLFGVCYSIYKDNNTINDLGLTKQDIKKLKKILKNL